MRVVQYTRTESFGAQLVPLNFLIKFPLHDFNFPLSDDFNFPARPFSFRNDFYCPARLLIFRHNFYFLARLLFSGTTSFFSGTTFIVRHDFYFTARLLFSGTTSPFFPARLLFFGTTFFSGTTSGENPGNEYNDRRTAGALNTWKTRWRSRWSRYWRIRRRRWVICVICCMLWIFSKPLGADLLVLDVAIVSLSHNVASCKIARN